MIVNLNKQRIFLWFLINVIFLSYIPHLPIENSTISIFSYFAIILSNIEYEIPLVIFRISYPPIEY